MKILFCLLFFCSFGLFSQDASFSFLPRKLTISSALQNEDIFVSLGAGHELKYRLSAEVRWGFGSRRTFFQRALFSKTDLLLHYDFLKSTKWKIGPSILFSCLSLSPRILKPIQRYYSTELGYYLAYGKKMKVIQSSYFAFRSTNFVTIKGNYRYLGYSFQIGMSYEI